MEHCKFLALKIKKILQSIFDRKVFDWKPLQIFDLNQRIKFYFMQLVKKTVGFLKPSQFSFKI